MAAPVFFVGIRLPLTTLRSTTVLLQWSSRRVGYWANKNGSIPKPRRITGYANHKHLRTFHSDSQSHYSKTHKENKLLRYLRSLKWYPIPIGVGFAYICYQQLGHISKRERRKLSKEDAVEALAQDWQVMLYKMFPLRAMSRLWGKVNSMNLPTWLRSPVYSSYIKAFNCNLEEAAVEDLQYYKNLGEFFRRKLKPTCRTVDPFHFLVSPVDGRILHLGKVAVPGYVEQVKGVNYSLQEFLGPRVDLTENASVESTVDENSNNTSSDHITRHHSLPDTTKINDSRILRRNNSDLLTVDVASGKSADEKLYHMSLFKNFSGTQLYHCVIYLAPGDYHCFHSPAAWQLMHRRHFPGELFSVNPGIARWIAGLFNYNERVVLSGQWKHGFFSMTAVGATNVGSIKVLCDTDLSTNHKRWDAGTYYDKDFRETSSGFCGVPYGKGELFGEFNLGSTIVLVFEAPENFTFLKQSGDRIKMGEALGTIGDKNDNN